MLTLESIDRVAAQIHHLRHGVAGKRAPKWKPLHIPRPDEKSAPAKPLSIAEFRARIEEEGA